MALAIGAMYGLTPGTGAGVFWTAAVGKAISPAYLALGSVTALASLAFLRPFRWARQAMVAVMWCWIVLTVVFIGSSVVTYAASPEAAAIPFLRYAGVGMIAAVGASMLVSFGVALWFLGSARMKQAVAASALQAHRSDAAS
jgi:hypothetical protein